MGTLFKWMNPCGAGFTADYPGDVLNALAIGLAADTSESGQKALAVIRARSPELLRLSEQTGEDLLTTSTNFIDVLLLSLRFLATFRCLPRPWKLCLRSGSVSQGMPRGAISFSASGDASAPCSGR